MEEQQKESLEPQRQSESSRAISVVAFARQKGQGNSQAIPLDVYLLNESSAMLEILNDLDSINIPQMKHARGETGPDGDLIHVDFGVSEAAGFIPVGPGECVKVTLLLRKEQLALLERVRQLKTAVKFREGGGDSTTLLLPAPVYWVKQ